MRPRVIRVRLHRVERAIQRLRQQTLLLVLGLRFVHEVAILLRETAKNQGIGRRQSIRLEITLQRRLRPTLLLMLRALSQQIGQ